MPYLVSNSRGVSKISLPSVRWVVLHMIEETARATSDISTSVPVDRVRVRPLEPAVKGARAQGW